jgi:TonB family protein
MSTLSKETIETANGGDTASLQPSVSTQPAPAQIHSDAVSLEVPLKVHGSKVTEILRGVTPHTEPFEEQASSMIVFPHGGVLRMSTSVNAGQMLVLTNLKSRQDAICRVVKVRTYSNSSSYVEVEFTHRQPGYWGVYFESEAEQESLAKDPVDVVAPASESKPAKPVSSDSRFIHFGSQEEVQPAASSTTSASVARVVPGPTSSKTTAEIPTVNVSQAQTSLNSSTEGRNKAQATPPTTSAAAAGIRARESDAPAIAAKIEATSLPLSEATAKTAESTFGSRLSSPLSNEQSAEGSNWFLIATCGAALFLAIGGGILLLRHKSPDVATATVQPSVAQSPVTQPVTTPPPQPVSVTPSASKLATSLSTVRETPSPVVKPDKEMAVVKESPSISDSATQPQPIVAPAPASRTSMPSVFGTLNAHPVARRQNVTTTAPNVDAGAPSGGENALLGITSPPNSSALPPPAFNANVPMPVGGRIKKPELLSRVLPQYPMLARQAHTQGEVALQIVVDKSGSVSEAKAISGPATLRQAAIDAVRRWKYESPDLDGQAITVEMLVTVRFQL